MGCPVEVAPRIGRPISKVVSIINGAKGFMVVWGRIQKHIRICFRMNSTFRGRCLTDEQKGRKLARRSRSEWRTIAIWTKSKIRDSLDWGGTVSVPSHFLLDTRIENYAMTSILELWLRWQRPRGPDKQRISNGGKSRSKWI